MFFAIFVAFNCADPCIFTYVAAVFGNEYFKATEITCHCVVTHYVKVWHLRRGAGVAKNFHSHSSFLVGTEDILSRQRMKLLQLGFK